MTNTNKLKMILALLVAMTIGGPVVGASPHPAEACGDLDSAQMPRANRLLQKIHPYECCDSNLARCLKTNPCALVKRLANDVCRRVASGQDDARIERAIDRRGAVALPTTKRHSIDLSEVAWAGDASSPVTAVVYLCPRCPFCARMAPALYREVTGGELKGKVRLGVKMFPLRGHQDAVPGAMAVMAANELDSFWPFLLHLYSRFDQYDPNRLPELAAEKGLDQERFRALMKDGNLRKKLIASKKEGVRVGVDATPTVFIEGRQYSGELGVNDVIDALEESHERKTGILCR